MKNNCLIVRLLDCLSVRRASTQAFSHSGIIAVVFLALFMWLAVPTQAQTPDVGVTTTVEYDAESGGYVRVTRVGEMVINREYMSFEEYQEYQMDQLMKKYWNERTSVGDTAADDDRPVGINSIPCEMSGKKTHKSPAESTAKDSCHIFVHEPLTLTH